MIIVSVANLSGVGMFLDNPAGLRLFGAEETFRMTLQKRGGNRLCLVNMCMVSKPTVLSIATPLLHQRFTHMIPSTLGCVMPT